MKPFFPIRTKSLIWILIPFTLLSGCQHSDESHHPNKLLPPETAEFFQLHPQLESTYGFTQAVRIGSHLKIGGVISIDESGKPIGVDDYLLQMKNVYASIKKVLHHFGCDYDDIIVENIYTTSMMSLQQHASYRQNIYKKQFPTGTWVGVKELGLPEIQIEIEIEAIIPASKKQLK